MATKLSKDNQVLDEITKKRLRKKKKIGEDRKTGKTYPN